MIVGSRRNDTMIVGSGFLGAPPPPPPPAPWWEVLRELIRGAFRDFRYRLDVARRDAARREWRQEDDDADEN